jgi:hypothetical protein
MTGVLYITTGLAVELTYIVITHAMLAMREPIFALSSFVFETIFFIGPSLLLLSGISTTAPNARRGGLCLISGIVSVAALALWAAPRMGWRYAGWLVLEPAAVSLVLAYFALVLLKKRWISALIGSSLSAPFSVLLIGSLLYGIILGANGTQFTPYELWYVIPGAFVTGSFISSLSFRNI